jgi:hypothetical protein
MPAQRTLALVHRVIAFVAGLVLVCDLAVVGVHVLDNTTDLVTGRGSATDAGGARPGPGQAFVTGEVDHLAADDARSEPLRSPFTLTAVEPEGGWVTIEKAMVSGRRVDISWDGGVPLPVDGEGGLDLGAAHVDVDAESVVWSLGGSARTLLPGTYRLGAPVAVGGGGLATPREGVEFTADDETVVASRGHVVVRLDATRVELQGPGKMTAEGRLRVRFPDKSVSTSSVTLEEGPFRVTLEPSDGKVRVDAVLQGSVETG